MTTNTVHRQIEEYAKAGPESVALIYEDRTYTYGELDRHARYLATVLRRRTPGPGDLIGLYGSRSPEAVIGLLAILKSGAGYVPLDPSHPRQHIDQILNAAGLKVVVNASVASLPFELDGVEHVPVWQESTDAVLEEGGLPDVALEDMAAVMFTSGSEGAPKGVVISHRAIVSRRLQAQGLNPRREMSCVTASVSNIGHISSLLIPLMGGCSVVIASDGAIHNFRLLAELTRRYGVTTIPLVPTQFRALLNDEKALQLFGHLRAVVLRAEPVPPALVSMAKGRLPGVTLLNGYGATETTGLVSYARIVDPARIVIGNNGLLPHMHILDGDVEAPVGATGELCVTGPQLASGYLGDPELTAKRFVANPFGSAGEVMYRTGDFARCLPDGAVEIVGRADQQVKVRGHRVNLAEVESVLQRIAGVERAVVLVRRERVHAYLIAQGQISEIRSALSEQVPAHMVPEVMTILSEFPLLPGGKVDRLALTRIPPDPGNGSGAAFRTDYESMIADIWSDVLATPAIGLGDDFFDLGGNSLDAMMILSRIEDVFGVGLDMEELVRHSTVEAFGRRLEELGARPNGKSGGG